MHILDRKDFDGGIVADIEDALRFVEIYTDRIEVVSPGGLPKGMTLADLGTKSVRRNALIADLLHRIDFIEKAGTGIKRIRDEARDGGYPEPAWEANGFTTAIFRPNPEARAETQAGPRRAAGRVGARSGGQSGGQAAQVLAALTEGERSAAEVAEAIGLRSKTGATGSRARGGGLVQIRESTRRWSRSSAALRGGEAFDEQPMPGLGSEGVDFRAASELFAPVCKLGRRDLETLRTARGLRYYLEEPSR